MIIDCSGFFWYETEEVDIYNVVYILYENYIFLPSFRNKNLLTVSGALVLRC